MLYLFFSQELSTKIVVIGDGGNEPCSQEGNRDVVYDWSVEVEKEDQL